MSSFMPERSPHYSTSIKQSRNTDHFPQRKGPDVDEVQSQKREIHFAQPSHIEIAQSNHTQSIKNFSQDNPLDLGYQRKETDVKNYSPDSQGVKYPNIIPATKENAIGPGNSDLKTPYDFTENELKDIFNILDRGSHSYLSFSDLKFFLNLLLIDHSDADIVEMIRMADNQGNKRVYFDQFVLMAKGKLVSPIGLAYPPTIDMLNNKNIKPENMVKNQQTNLRSLHADNPKFTHKQLDISDQRDDRQAKDKQYDSQAPGLSYKGNKQEQSRKDKIAQLNKLFNGPHKLDFSKAFDHFKDQAVLNIENVPIEDCLPFFNNISSDNLKSLLGPFSKNHAGKSVNLQEILINWITFQNWTDTNKAYMAFYVMDIHSSGYITFEQFYHLLCWIHLENVSDRREKMLKQIFEIMKLNLLDAIDIRTMENIIHSYQTSLLDPTKMKVNSNDLNSEFDTNNKP
jgi:Ca2+-binding EF-hand superfamily protein